MPVIFIERNSPKPNNTEPYFSSVGTPILKELSDNIPIRMLSIGIMHLQTQGFLIQLRQVSGGYFIHYSSQEARATGSWGFYSAVSTRPLAAGGVSEFGDIYNLLDNGQVKPSHLSRKTDPIESKKAGILETAYPSDKFKPLDLAQQQELLKFMKSKIRRTEDQGVIPAEIIGRFRPSITIESTLNGPLATLRYLVAKRILLGNTPNPSDQLG